MKVIALARRPVVGAIAQTALDYGCGAMNIDGTRLRTGDNLDGGAYSPGGRKSLPGDQRSGASAGMFEEGGGRLPGQYAQPLGRWPANLILQHQPGCRQTGTTTAPGYTINRWTDGAKPFGGGAGHAYESEQQPDESVLVWECARECPAMDLGVQSGHQVSGVAVQRHGGGQKIGGIRGIYSGSRGLTREDLGYGDSGTASRFFKQVQETKMNELPQELVDYLETMITPPEGEVLVSLDLDEVHWEIYEDNQLHGLVGQGDPTPHMDEIWRILRPGAFVAMIAPDAEPTGHTGACALEGKGFEIRDSILLVQEPGRIHYVAKCSTAERNAGIVPFERKVTEKRLFPKPEHYDDIEEAFAETKTEQELLAWAEGGATRAEIPKENREWFEEKEVEVVRKKQNDHATVKPKDVMRRLIGDLPPGSMVVDPFLGSGSTGIACVDAGQNFVGIELEMPSLQIAEARIQHWDAQLRGTKETQITSEAEKPKRKKRNFLKMRREK